MCESKNLLVLPKKGTNWFQISALTFCLYCSWVVFNSKTTSNLFTSLSLFLILSPVLFIIISHSLSLHPTFPSLSSFVPLSRFLPLSCFSWIFISSSFSLTHSCPNLYLFLSLPVSPPFSFSPSQSSHRSPSLSLPAPHLSFYITLVGTLSLSGLSDLCSMLPEWGLRYCKWQVCVL